MVPMRKALPPALVIVLAISSLVAGALLWPRPSHVGLKRFSSYEELKAFVLSSRLKARYCPDAKAALGMRAEVRAEAYGPTPPQALRYSKTNVQVEGVDEADVVKTDGEFIYTISNRSVAIVKAYPPEEACLVSRIEFGMRPTSLFINKDMLVVFGDQHTDLFYTAFTTSPHELPPGSLRSNTTVWVLDVSNRAEPRPIRTIAVDGCYVASRMIGNYIYLVTCCPVLVWTHGGRTPDIYVPQLYVDGRAQLIPAHKIWYVDVPDVDYDYTIVMALDLSDPMGEPSYEVFLTGLTTCVYVSRENLYLAVPHWTGSGEETLLFRVCISGGEIVPEAQGSVPGFVLNQFSMDEHDGYFRIATTATTHREEYTWENNIYVLDVDLCIVGRLEGLAPGERIYAARFMGNRCYLVTFRKVDPFFVIDISDPMAPKVLGKLKLPGYSDYLHPLDDDHIIGVGKETVPAEEGDFSWYQGLKIALFDVSNPEEPKLIDKLVMGDRGTDSPVLRDHKALLFDAERGIMVLPVLLAEIDEDMPPYVEGDYVWQGAVVLHVSIEDGIEVLGNITHMEDPSFFDRLGYYCPESPYFIRRALYIGDVLYTVSEAMVLMNDVWTLAELGCIYL
mgnify:CR=1 FL=1